jgi:hypothetical protein
MVIASSSDQLSLPLAGTITFVDLCIIRSITGAANRHAAKAAVGAFIAAEFDRQLRAV